MSIFEYLSDTDKAMMEEYIDSYAIEDAGRSASLQHLMRYWSSGKEPLYKAFGNRFVIEKPVKFEKQSFEIVKEVEAAIDRKLKEEFKEKLLQLFYDGVIFDLYDVECIYSLFSTQVLSENRYNFKDIEFDYEGKSFKLARGTKPFRAIQKLAAILSIPEERVEKFRIKISQVLNQKYLTGTMCLSIHPLDYMTMSDNEENWQSCMSWKKCGCYRQGTVEMMNSPMVVVGYLKSDSNFMRIDSNKWNSKKWRELFIVNEDIITNCKPYPYTNMEFSEICVDWLRDIVKDAFGWTYSNTRRINYGEDFDEDNGYEDYEDYFYAETCHMYNDFDNAREINRYCHLNGYPRFNYSGEFVCMACGDVVSYLDQDDGTLICDDCAEEHYYDYFCTHCGCGLDECDTYESVTGDIYCSDCYGEELEYCPILDGRYPASKTMPIFIVDDKTNKVKGFIECCNLVRHREHNAEMSDNFDKIYSYYDGSSHAYFAYLSDTNKGLYNIYGTDIFSAEYDSLSDALNETLLKVSDEDVQEQNRAWDLRMTCFFEDEDLPAIRSFTYNNKD